MFEDEIAPIVVVANSEPWSCRKTTHDLIQASADGDCDRMLLTTSVTRLVEFQACCGLCTP